MQRVRQDTAVSATFGLQGPLETYVRPLPMDAFEHPIEAISSNSYLTKKIRHIGKGRTLFVQLSPEKMYQNAGLSIPKQFTVSPKRLLLEHKGDLYLW